MRNSHNFLCREKTHCAAKIPRQLTLKPLAAPITRHFSVYKTPKYAIV